VLNPEHHMREMVAMGSPVRWIKVHPLVRVAFVSPMLAGLVRVRGTRRFAEAAMPLLVKHSPWLISIYMNPELTDTTAIGDMVHTVEDPNRYINRELARWIKKRDLVMRGVNIAEKLRAVRSPFLCVLAHGDGVVPRETAAFAFHQIGARDKELLVVGDELMRHAHADLFVSTEAHERVFRPISAWLARCPR
jgi:alpha-beta hydrolase superfamily lysophospholipase